MGECLQAHKDFLRRALEKVDDLEEEVEDQSRIFWAAIRVICQALEDQDDLVAAFNDNIPDVLGKLTEFRAKASEIVIICDGIEKAGENGPWTTLAMSLQDQGASYARFLDMAELIGKQLNSARN